MPEPTPTLTAMRPSSGERSNARARNEPKPALIWPSGPLTAGPAGADRQRRSDDLYHHGAQADAPGVVVHGVDGGVGPVPFGLGREAEDQPAGK